MPPQRLHTTDENHGKDPPADAPSALWNPPGGILAWMIVTMELVTFGAGFIVFATLEHRDQAAFAAGRALLHQPIALANTLILLTGGWCMAMGLDRLRGGGPAAATRWISGAVACGLAFLVLKGFEYADKLAHGHVFGRDTFFTLYWLLTGFHVLHVLVAVVLLAVMARAIRRGRYGPHDCEDVEASGVFWHLCDMLWLLLYPVVYLTR